ncbi:aspartyl/asparaginyl beta-hydroxylase domain-containing protein [Pseudoalteromonas rubra]|uniref:Aspartyl/asparaginyl beta-hydroxylase domain-containing protein n=1 Tax=Pseudoalteromonas rubra TaxID=43658 RepID=A0A5S3WR11_9GAMM|nr:aspartyl/asparaginyl beta-hydroxylase domain-containing protein [Pseudoalteromonas rubra]TMP29974.1 aspartyl/asparaginyl beta-hydroxylase domain-containing protein [Pseudoalteromonas rubra]TMP32202.1 aspartyl/asparaginyl beta-hydroxylase domain-containing protein [Pseudoalteromonas rubra]
MKALEAIFDDIEELFGSGCLDRVKTMITDNQSYRVTGQEGAKWVMPGLSSSAWLDPANTASELQAAIAQLEANADLISQEYHQARQANILTPYDHYLGRRDNWDGLYLFRDEDWTSESSEYFPNSSAKLKSEFEDLLCPLLEVHFSILGPGSHIPPHSDLWNFTLNLHLAIDIPADCDITVNGETRGWQNGKALLFDYSFVHEASNRSQSERVCLLMDVWHPDLTPAERYALTSFVQFLRG